MRALGSSKVMLKFGKRKRENLLSRTINTIKQKLLNLKLILDVIIVNVFFFFFLGGGVVPSFPPLFLFVCLFLLACFFLCLLACNSFSIFINYCHLLDCGKNQHNFVDMPPSHHGHQNRLKNSVAWH